jgi:hypothetical protein
MSRALEQQARQWDALSRAEKDAASDMLLFNRAQQEGKDRTDRLAQSTRTVTIAYAAASAGLLGWVKAGLSGTTAGEMLAFQQNQLSQQIASIFLPVVQKYTEGLTRLVEWFRHLSGSQQEQIRNWSLFTVGLLGSVTIIPRLTAAFGTLATTLKGLFIANPFAALTAAVVGLMAQTEEGRKSLADLGTSLSEAFGSLADLLSGPVAAGLEGLAKFVSSAPGQWLAWGTIAVSVLYRIAAAGQGAATSFLGWGTAIGAAVLLLGGLFTTLSRSKDEAIKTGTEIEKALRAGRITPEEAREQLRQQAEEAAVEAEARAREEIKRPGSRFAEQGPERAAEYATEQGRKAREETLREGEAAIRRGGQGRSDVVRAVTGTEDPRATIRRLEASILKTDVQDQIKGNTGQTAAAAQEIAAFLRDMARRFGLGQRDQPMND